MWTGAPQSTAAPALGVASRKLQDDPGRPSARRRGLAPQLDWITSRLLAKNPADRPPSAAAARAWLLAAVSGDHTRVLPRPHDGEGMTRRQQSARRKPSRQRPIDRVRGIALAAALD